MRRLCTTLSRGGVETLPVFPVELEPMARVRERLATARRLDKLLLDNRYKRDKDKQQMTVVPFSHFCR